MNPIVVRYQYTEEEAVRASREVLRAISPGFFRISWLGAAMLAVPLLLIALDGRVPEGSWFLPVLGTILLLLPWITSRMLRRQFRGSPSRDQTITWTIDDVELRNEAPGSSGKFAWRMLVDVREHRDGFLLFPQPRLAHWIPKSGFASPEAIDAFRELIRRSGVKHSGAALGPGEKPRVNKWALGAAIALLVAAMTVPFVWLLLGRTDDFAAALGQAALPVIVAAILLGVGAIFPSNRNWRTRAKVIFWAGLISLVTALLTAPLP